MSDKEKTSDSKYRQYTRDKKNCKQGHWTGIPKGSVVPSGCWLCQKGCFVLSYLKWKNKEPNEENVTSLLDKKADVVWDKMGVKRRDTAKAPCIGRANWKKEHYVFIKSIDANNNCTIFDPGDKTNTSKKVSDFKYFFY